MDDGVRGAERSERGDEVRIGLARDTRNAGPFMLDRKRKLEPEHVARHKRLVGEGKKYARDADGVEIKVEHPALGPRGDGWRVDANRSQRARARGLKCRAVGGAAAVL